jgi:hypothetical protein
VPGRGSPSGFRHNEIILKGRTSPSDCFLYSLSFPTAARSLIPEHRHRAQRIGHRGQLCLYLL